MEAVYLTYSSESAYADGSGATVRSEDDASGHDQASSQPFPMRQTGGLLGAKFSKISGDVIAGHSRFDLKETPEYDELIQQNGCTLLTVFSKTHHCCTQDARYPLASA
jgi:hypothetical protein